MRSKTRRRRKEEMQLIVLPLIILAVLLAIYIIPAIFYMLHFYKNTTINGEAAGNMTSSELEEIFTQKASEYTLRIHGRNGIEDEISAKNISLKPDFDGQFEGLISAQKAFLWPVKMLKKYDYELDAMTVYSDEALNAYITEMNLFKGQNIVKPKNAYISDTWGDDGYYIIEDEAGADPIKDKVKSEIEDAIDSLNEEVTLSDACYNVAAIRADNAELKKDLDAINKYYGANIYYVFGEDTINVRDYIADWIVETDNGSRLDEEQVREFVNSLSRKYDTFGINREFKKHDGSTITVKGGTYGWWMNRPEETAELIAAIENKESGQRTPVYYSTAVQYGDNDIGDTYVEVDLTQQHLWVYENGVSVLDCDFVSGNVSKGHGTHTGVYGITYKERDATLQGQGYSSPVSYWMPFNENEGLHDASWRSEFGGEIYLTNGSHGCVNLPKKSAEKIYEIVKKDEPVVVFGGKTEVPAENIGMTPEEQLAALIQAGLLNPDGTVPEGSDVIPAAPAENEEAPATEGEANE